jgi:hypothetical protein
MHFTSSTFLSTDSFSKNKNHLLYAELYGASFGVINFFVRLLLDLLSRARQKDNTVREAKGHLPSPYPFSRKLYIQSL